MPRVLALLAAAGLLAGVYVFLRPSPEFPPPKGLLLVTLDTTRADALGVYGATGDPTPTLDRLAREGVRFLHAFAPVPITLPAHAALLTGRYPRELGVRDNSPRGLPPGIPTLAEGLRGRGYRTAAFVSAAPLERRWGLARGFERYDDRLRPADHPLHLRERPGGETVAAALRWVAEGLRPGEPFFLWVHLFDPHRPYRPPPEFRRRFPDDPYRGEVAYADRCVERLLAGLRRRGRLADTLVVVTADHGEGLGEHGEDAHGHLLFRSTVGVPLLFWWPGRLAPRTVAGAVSLVDVAPTLAELLGCPFPATGRSLLGALRGRDLPPRPVYVESLYDFLHFGWAPLDGVRTARWHLLAADDQRLLFDLEADPGETRDVAAARPAVVRTLEAARERFRARRRLRPARGPLEKAPPTYLQGTPAASTLAREADRAGRRRLPWRSMALVRRFEAVSRLAVVRTRAAQGEALRRLARLLREDPENPAFRYWHGRVQRNLALLREPPDGERLLAAAEDFRRVLRRRPAHMGAQNLLLQCLLYLGQAEAVIRAARAVIEQGCENRDTRLFLAEAYLLPGPGYDPRRAAAINREARRRYPRNPRLRAQAQRIQELLAAPGRRR